MKKLLYILLDGVGDRPDPRLNWVTPLDSARTRWLDSLARRGVSGLVDPVGEGIPPESDAAVFNMLGYDTSSGYVGRGVVELMGAGVDFQNGWLALRGNFATVGDDLTVVDRRAGRDLSLQEALTLTEAVNREVKLSNPDAEFKLIHTIGHRTVLLIKVHGVDLSANISNTDPGYERAGGIGVARRVEGETRIRKCVPLDDEESSKFSASLVDEFTVKAVSILNSHPVNLERMKLGKMIGNAILLRDAGNSLPATPRLSERFGLSFACIADMPVERGIARILGMSEFQAGGMGDYEVKAEQALKLLERFDSVYVHLKGPDEPGHDGDAGLKKKVIGEIDSRFFRNLALRLELDETFIVVSADHATPCVLKAHSGDPVPLLISGGGVKSDGTCRFTERDAAKGSLGRLRGVEVLPRVASMIRKCV